MEVVGEDGLPPVGTWGSFSLTAVLSLIFVDGGVERGKEVDRIARTVENFERAGLCRTGFLKKPVVKLQEQGGRKLFI